MSNEDVRSQENLRKLMQTLAQAMHEIVKMIVTVQDMGSTGGGPHSGGVGPHIDALVRQGHDFDLTARQLDGLISQLKSLVGPSGG